MSDFEYKAIYEWTDEEAESFNDMVRWEEEALALLNPKTSATLDVARVWLRSKPTETPRCSKCNEVNEYAEVPASGVFTCYGCR